MTQHRTVERWEYLPQPRRSRALTQRLRRLMAGDLSPSLKLRLNTFGIKPAELRDLAQLQDLPILRKHELVGEAGPTLGGRLGVPIEQLRSIFMSPGPIYDPQGDRKDFWGWTPALKAAGFLPGDLVLICFSYHLTPAGRMFDDGCQALGCVTIPGGVGEIAQQVRILADLPIVGYIGLPSYLHKLLQRAEDEKQSLSLRRALVSAEPLPSSLRAELEHRGLFIRQAYGTADVGCIAYECRQADGLHLRPDIWVEICDPETGQDVEPGQPGEVVVSLLEPAYPLLRLGTGDLSAIRYEPCSCGRTTPRLVGVLGRSGEGIKVRGVFVYPAQLRLVFSSVPGIVRGQAVVRRRDHRDELEVQAVLKPGTAVDPTLEALRQRLQEVLKLRAHVTAIPPAVLPPDAAPLSDQRRWE